MKFFDRIVLFLAEGLGTGRIPFAPGTFGSALGFAWIGLLLLPQNLWIYLAGTAAGIVGAIWIGERAEEILQLKDPNRIVIDEIVAMPVAFGGCVVWLSQKGVTPGLTEYLSGTGLLLMGATFFLFRVLDVLKPMGIHRVQDLPGGLGLVLDDVAAAAAVGVMTFGLSVWLLPLPVKP